MQTNLPFDATDQAFVRLLSFNSNLAPLESLELIAIANQSSWAGFDWFACLINACAQVCSLACLLTNQTCCIFEQQPASSSSFSLSLLSFSSILACLRAFLLIPRSIDHHLSLRARKRHEMIQNNNPVCGRLSILLLLRLHEHRENFSANKTFSLPAARLLQWNDH